MLCKKLKKYSVFMVPLSQKKQIYMYKIKANKENGAKNKNNKEILNP